jgi:hypothetical protein
MLDMRHRSLTRMSPLGSVPAWRRSALAIRLPRAVHSGISTPTNDHGRGLRGRLATHSDMARLARLADPLKASPSGWRPVRAPGSHSGRPSSAGRLVAPAKPRRPTCDTAHDGPPDSRLALRPWTASGTKSEPECPTFPRLCQRHQPVAGLHCPDHLLSRGRPSLSQRLDRQSLERGLGQDGRGRGQ